MADAYQLETSTDLYLLEDGSGVYLLETSVDVLAPLPTIIQNAVHHAFSW
jgi:hypothetical protein